MLLHILMEITQQQCSAWLSRRAALHTGRGFQWVTGNASQSPRVTESCELKRAEKATLTQKWVWLHYQTSAMFNAPDIKMYKRLLLGSLPVTETSGTLWNRELKI